MMIQKLNVKDPEMAKKILEVQIPSYQVEAELINFYGIPQLKDTVETLMRCGEIFYGYFIQGELAGAIAFKKEGTLLDIHRLVVHPDHFRKGIGRELVNHVLEQERDAKRFLVRTGTKNIPARKLYEKLGFMEIGEQEAGPGVSLTLFEKVV
jgi:ribosomal protein S18 acetylase RimI-like enzyme